MSTLRLFSKAENLKGRGGDSEKLKEGGLCSHQPRVVVCFQILLIQIKGFTPDGLLVIVASSETLRVDTNSGRLSTVPL